MLATLTLAWLPGCAGDQPLWAPPPHAEVPPVAAEAYPTLGTTPPDGRKVLNEEQRKKLEGDLDRLAKQRDKRARDAAEKNTN